MLKIRGMRLHCQSAMQPLDNVTWHTTYTRTMAAGVQDVNGTKRTLKGLLELAVTWEQDAGQPMVEGSAIWYADLNLQVPRPGRVGVAGRIHLTSTASDAGSAIDHVLLLAQRLGLTVTPLSRPTRPRKTPHAPV